MVFTDDCTVCSGRLGSGASGGSGKGFTDEVPDAVDKDIIDGARHGSFFNIGTSSTGSGKDELGCTDDVAPEVSLAPEELDPGSVKEGPADAAPEVSVKPDLAGVATAASLHLKLKRSSNSCSSWSSCRLLSTGSGSATSPYDQANECMPDSLWEQTNVMTCNMQHATSCKQASKIKGSHHRINLLSRMKFPRSCKRNKSYDITSRSFMVTLLLLAP